MFKIQLLTLAVCLCDILQGLEAAKILAVFGIPHPVQNEFAAALLSALDERGHEITVIIRFANNLDLPKRVKKINTDENNELFREFFAISGKNYNNFLLNNIQRFFDKNALLTLNAMKNPLVKQLMKHDHFDLIILDAVMSEALYGLGEYFNAPMIAVSNFFTQQPVDDLVGNFSPISTIPSIYTQHTFETTFIHRVLNAALSAFDKLVFSCLHLPNQQKLYRQIFPNATLTFDQARRNFSLVLLNQHFSLSCPRPYVPNMMEAAGLHINDNLEVLPLEVETFLNNSMQDVIYIGLSVGVQTLNIQPYSFIIPKLLHALQELNYKVIWHMDHLTMAGYNDSNILQISNISRCSVLNQPKVKLCITSGDIQSIIEAVHFARPILGLPLFSDQHLNMNMAIKAGYGLSIKFITLTEDKIKDAILELLTNPDYLQTVKQLSKIFRDQPMKPKEKAIYWVEYVLRHNGAKHLMSKGRFLNFWQFHNIDVFAFYIVMLLFIIFINWLILKFLYYLVRKMSYNLKTKIKKS